MKIQDIPFAAEVRRWHDRHDRYGQMKRCHRCGTAFESTENRFGDHEDCSDDDGWLCDTCGQDWEDYQRGKADEATREFYDGGF